jgi:hypothetical protein
MATEKFGYRDFFSEELFTPVIENINQLIEAVNKASEVIGTKFKASVAELTQVVQKAKSAQDVNAESLREIAEAQVKVEGSGRQLLKMMKQLKDLQEKLAILQDKESKGYDALAAELAKLRFQVKDTEAAYKRFAAAESSAQRAAEALQIAQKVLTNSNRDLAYSYADLSNALNDLRERYKNLIVAGQGNTEEAAQLRNAIAQLDAFIKQLDYSVGQYQRNVGNYSKSFKEALNEMLLSQGAVGKSIIGLGFAAQRAGDAFRAAGGGARGFFKAIVEGSKALRSVGVILLLEALSSLISKFGSSEELQKAQEKLKLLQQEIEFNERLASIKQRLDRIKGETLTELNERVRLLREQAAIEQKALAEREKRLRAELDKARKEAKEIEESLITKAFQLWGKALGAIIRGFAGVIDGLAALATSLRQTDLANRISDIANKIRKAADAVQDFYLSFRAEDRKKAIEKQIQAEEELANMQLKRREILADLAKQEAEIAEERKKLIEETLKSLEVETEAETAREKLLEERRKRLEELQNAYLEAVKRFQNDTENLEKARQKFEASLAKIQADFIRKEAQLIKEQTDKLIKIRNELSQSALDAEIAAINTRYNEIVEQIRVAEKEIGETQEELIRKAEASRLRAIQAARLRAADADIKLRQELAIARIDAERANFEKEEDFIKYREQRVTEIQLQFAKERLEKLKELFQITGDAQVELEIARTEGLIAQLNARLQQLSQQATQNAQNILQEYIKAAQAIIDGLETYFRRLDERSAANLEKERGILQRRISVFEGLAKEGSLAASESIAELEKREAELIKKSEDLKKKAQRREFALAAIKTYTQLLERNAPNALAQTIRDITLLSQLIARLPTFYEGTEYVNTGVRIPNAVRDALIVRVHEGERIVPAHINRQLQGIRNEDLPKLFNTERIEFDADSFLNTFDLIIRRKNETKRIKRAL